MCHFHDGDYKTNKVIKFYKEKQVNEFIRVKTIVILKLMRQYI